MSTYDDKDFGALDRLEDLLDAYVEGRLMPRSPVLARIRANVMAEAAATASAAASRLQFDEPPRPARWAASSLFARRAFALGFAAMLTLGTTAAVLAAPPGSAFYNARVYIETLALPARADARLEGHERLLQERIAEAQAAGARGDAVGLAAALAAYQAEVAAATGDVGDNAALLAQLEEMLAKHTATLTALEAKVPGQSSIDKAIDESSKAIEKIKAKGNPAAHPTRAPGGPHGQEQGPQR
jgi:hypothetical protein